MSADDKPNERLATGAGAPRTPPLPASAAHEINNQLESLLNLLYLLDTEPTLTEKGRHYLVLAEEEVRRISQIARDTLDQYKVFVIPEKKGRGIQNLLESGLRWLQSQA